MKLTQFVVAAGALLQSSTAIAAYSNLKAQYKGRDFIEQFDFHNSYEERGYLKGPDPTKGTVHYVPRDDAVKSGLVSEENGRFKLKVDTSGALVNGNVKSVRIQSKQRFTHGLYVLDVEHIPSALGTWPAFWTYGPDGRGWPHEGEIDIIENVHNNTYNAAALHTGPGCETSFSGNGNDKAGKVKATTCNSENGFNGNIGCASEFAHDSASFGGAFNNRGGGVYVMEWNSEFIKIWHFLNGDPNAENARSANPEPANWGKPDVHFQGACEIDRHFKNHVIVFNITLCGEWGGAVWGGKFPGTCDEHVRNPNNLHDAFWLINSLRVFHS